MLTVAGGALTLGTAVVITAAGLAAGLSYSAQTGHASDFGRVLVRERILWVRFAPDLRISLDGTWADLPVDAIERLDGIGPAGWCAGADLILSAR